MEEGNVSQFKASTVLVKKLNVSILMWPTLFLLGHSASANLENFSLHSRQLLCDEIINAKRFVGERRKSYYKRNPHIIPPTLTNWHSVGESIDGIINYQRKASYASDQTEKTCSVRFSQKHVKMKVLQCVETSTAEWFITIGLVEKVMYLLEPDEKGRLLMTGMFEPSAIISNRSPEYFYDQLQSQTSKGRTRVTSVGLFSKHVLH
jgi:hypothetical protein